MSTNSTARVHYYDKQFLRLDEFRDEQLYQLALRRRHNISQHTWGIVQGLELAIEEGAVVVQPGLAIDGYGRELLLPTKVTLAPETFDDLATDRLDAWLAYDRQSQGAPPAGYAECGAVAGDSYRAAEVPKVLFERSLPNQVDPRRPPGVPAEVLAAPVPPTSDEPADTWRVYLGRIIRLDGQISFDPSRRPYAGVVAETIDHPANAARLEIGKHSSVAAERTVGGVAYAYERNQERRFGVFVPEDLPAASSAKPEPLAPRLEITADGSIHLCGPTIINGNLRLAAGAIRFVDLVDPHDSAISPPPEAPSIYRICEEGNDQLRIDLGATDSAKRQFVIGFSTQDGVFNECLRIQMQEAGPLVTIRGDLKVGGLITTVGDDNKETPFPPLTLEAQAAILGSFQAGVAAGAGSG